MNIVNASKFKKKYLDPLMEIGVIKMTRPEAPNSRLQQYVLTELGKELLGLERANEQAADVSELRVNRLITEFAEALPRFPIGLPSMEEQYKNLFL